MEEIAAINSRTLWLKYRNLLHYGKSTIPLGMSDDIWKPCCQCYIGVPLQGMWNRKLLWWSMQDKVFFFGKKEVEVVRILSSSSYHRKTTWFSLYRVFICHLIAWLLLFPQPMVWVEMQNICLHLRQRKVEYTITCIVEQIWKCNPIDIFVSRAWNCQLTYDYRHL